MRSLAHASGYDQRSVFELFFAMMSHMCLLPAATKIKSNLSATGRSQAALSPHRRKHRRQQLHGQANYIRG